MVPAAKDEAWSASRKRTRPACSSSSLIQMQQNVSSYIGATTIREYVIGLEDKKATPVF